MTRKEFEKQLLKIADIHENRDKPMNYVEWFNNFNESQQKAIIDTWETIIQMYQKDLNALGPNSKESKAKEEEIMRNIDIALEQIIWIIEFKGRGATNWQNIVVAYEKPMYEAFENIKSEKDIENFKNYTIRYFGKFH